jgi:WD40-like Beta Propeller Repeat/RTX calcium-binding nonapeptide repeat (4 copies)
MLTRSARSLVALVGLGAMLVSLSTAQGGAFSGANGLIAYTCGTGICTINPDGTGRNPLLTTATDPSWSSGGGKIAYVDPVNGIKVANADGTNPVPLGTGAGATEPTYSADNTRVAYARAGDLWSSLANGTGFETRLTTDPADDADPAYSPDGSKIAFASPRGTTGYDLWILDLSSATPRPLTQATGDERHPSWSPSGASIVYTSSSNGHLFTVSTSGTGVNTGTDLNVVGSDPTYSPDGTTIAFIDASGRLASVSSTSPGTPTPIDSSATLSQPDWQEVPPTSTSPSTTGPPSNVSYPVIHYATGDTSPVVGHLLTAGIGTWGGSATIIYTYQWKRCDANDALNGPCFAISGATSSFYTPTFSDYNMRLRVAVTATNSQGTASQNSEASAAVTAVAPKSRSTPQILGQNMVDQTLSLTAGVWDGASLVFTYSWRRCNPQGDLPTCVQIPGATGTTYVPTVQDIGFAIRVYITATNPAGSDTAITNHTYPVIDKPHFAPTVKNAPVIAGTAAIGRQLTANLGTYNGDAPITTLFTWQRCDATGNGCHAILGATKQVYFPTFADVGYTLRLFVTATNAYGAYVAASAPTEPIAAQPPRHKGRHIVGTAHADYLPGSGWDDVILGLGGNDTILGGAGDDRLEGGGGSDVITGGSGADKLFGGPGSDTIYAADGERDYVDCGPGNDRAVVDAVDKVVHCEVVTIAPAAR